SELDLKKAAKACGRKSIEMIPQKLLFPLTGYIHGGCSPIGMKKLFPTYIDETAILFDKICVSGGRIGTNLGLNPEELAAFINAQFVDLTK
ncbi:MAG: Cys-tRNA(Pro) deacylase, partial [Lentisphaeria bacterium]|nr:Cys-tRNA(Pro) deacylase [Lentisphaeria bacterium]